MRLPERAREGVFGLLAYGLYLVSSYQRRIAHRNLDFVFGEQISPAEKSKLARHSFNTLISNFRHLMEVKRMTEDRLLKKVSVENFAAVEKANLEERPIVYVTPHCGAWELGGVAIGVIDKPVTIIYTELSNPPFQSWMLGARSAFGNTMLAKTKALRPMVKLVKAKRSIAMVIDSSIDENQGVEVNFLGKKSWQTPTPAYLARKFNAAIIPFAVHANADNGYTLRFYDEIKVDLTDDIDRDIQKATEAQADWMTGLIMENPESWFWVHRKWKHEYPQLYKQVSGNVPALLAMSKTSASRR